MVLPNKLNLTNQEDLAKAEEELSKRKAKQLFDLGEIDTVEVGTYVVSGRNLSDPYRRRCERGKSQLNVSRKSVYPSPDCDKMVLKSSRFDLKVSLF